jgi:hypothetical protein
MLLILFCLLKYFYAISNIYRFEEVKKFNRNNSEEEEKKSGERLIF